MIQKIIRTLHRMWVNRFTIMECVVCGKNHHALSFVYKDFQSQKLFKKHGTLEADVFKTYNGNVLGQKSLSCYCDYWHDAVLCHKCFKRVLEQLRNDIMVFQNIDSKFNMYGHIDNTFYVGVNVSAVGNHNDDISRIFNLMDQSKLRAEDFHDHFDYRLSEENRNNRWEILCDIELGVCEGTQTELFFEINLRERKIIYHKSKETLERSLQTQKETLGHQVSHIIL